MVTVYAPASIGNVGVGFDILGMAITPIDGSFLGDCIRIRDSNTFNLKNKGLFSKQLPNKLEQNIVFQCWERFCQILNKEYPLFIELEKNVPISSGLGSSACSIVATLTAINYYCGSPFDNNRLFVLMGEIEGRVSGSVHFDNILPCFLGGMRLILQKNNIFSQRIPIFRNWLWILAYPGISISTMDSRSVLPEKYYRQDCITHSRFLSGFIHACHTKQEFLAVQCMQDIIAEPYRTKLFPVELSYIRDSLIKKGAMSCGISGSGPTIFALCNSMDVAEEISIWLSKHYLQNNLGFVRICSLNTSGIHIVKREI